MDEQTRRQITWIVVIGVVAALIAMAGGRRGEVDRLRTALAYGTPTSRLQAAARLVESQKLADAVANQPRWVQDNAVEAVGALGTEKAIFQLMSVWTVVDAPIQPRITATVARYGALAIPPLVEAMTDKDAKIRAGAPGVLTAIGEPTIPYLLPLMGAWDDYIRTGVATVFGGVGKPVCDEMVAMLKRPVPTGDQAEDTAKFLREKDCAVNSLLNMKVNALDAVTQELLPADDAELRGLASTMLGQIGSGLPPADACTVIQPLLDRSAKDPNWTVRRKATAALGMMGDIALLKGAVGPLQARLKDPRSEVRAAAAESLGKIISVALTPKKIAGDATTLVLDPVAAEAVAQKLAAQTAQIMAAALISNQSGASRELSAALVRVGPLGIGPLVPGLGNPDPAVRLLAADTIAQIGGPTAVGPLAKALGDPADAMVRRTAAEALRNQPPEALDKVGAPVLAALSKALQDQDWQVYYAARDALAKMGAPAVPVLLSALSSTNSRVGYLAEMALARIGGPAVPALVQALRAPNPALVNWAGIALGDIGDPAVKPLEGLLRDGAASVAARAAAADSLGRTGMGGALQPLLNSAKDANPAVRLAVLKGLGSLGDEKATEALVGALGDPAEPVRQQAMELLMNWRMGDVQAKLKAVVGGQNVEAQRRAAIVLVFQTSSVTNQLLRDVSASSSGQAEASDSTSLLPVLTAAALDKSATAAVQEDAIISLGYAGDEKTVGELKKLLTPGDPMVEPAAVAVARISSRVWLQQPATAKKALGEGATLLVDLVMKPSDPKLALAAATGLSNMGEIPVETLVDVLAKGTDEQKAWAGAILAAIGKPATELLLRVRGATKDPGQKTWTASTLQIIGDAMSMQIMKHLPSNEQPQPAQLAAITAKLTQIRQGQSQ